MADLFDIVVARKLSGGGGGGGVEPLIVISDAETEALNYTWREIHDAYIIEGRNIILASTYGENWIANAMTSIEKYPSENEYLVCFGSNASFTASSENEYPSAE